MYPACKDLSKIFPDDINLLRQAFVIVRGRMYTTSLRSTGTLTNSKTQMK